MSIPNDGIPGWERAELARAIHACESRALIAFYTHFRPMLIERAVAFGVPIAERADAVETFLGDMLLSLATGDQLPAKLHSYVLVSFRRYAARRGQAQQVEDNALAEFQRDFTASNCNSALKAFCDLLLAELDAEDRFLLAAKAEEMPLREIAGLLGLNYNAANTRLFRLRASLRDKAADVASRMDYSDRAVIEKFLRRARASAKGQLPSVKDAVDHEGRRRLSNG